VYLINKDLAGKGDAIRTLFIRYKRPVSYDSSTQQLEKCIAKRIAEHWVFAVESK
jgi:hypothetical protein